MGKQETKWYDGKIEEIKTLSKTMSDEQLMTYYNRTFSEIYVVIYNILKISQKERIKNLANEEVIQVYKYILNKERKLFPKGFLRNEQYIIILLKYLISDIFNWDRKQFCNNFSGGIINKYGLYTIRRVKTVNEIIYLISDMFNWNIKIWEIKHTCADKGFWYIPENIKDCLEWLKNKLKNEKSICNIYDAYHYGFANILSEYYLKGLLKFGYKNNCFNIFQDLYDTEFNIDYYNKNYYCFEINSELPNLNNNGIIYKITDKYYHLDDVKKTLINEVIKYCETNNQFPIAQDLMVNNGYISYRNIKKVFGRYSNIYKYIFPLQSIASYCWNIKENRVNYVKYYCEEKCDLSILTVIDSTELLKDWTSKYFNQSIIGKEMPWANEYVPRLYNLLIESYPQIKENNILFDWEWQSFYSNNKRRIEMLKELVSYRIKDIIEDPIIDIPKYLNSQFIETIYPKFNVMIRKKKFRNYFEWACLAFPEHRDKWTEKDFGIIVAKDNTIMSSFQEKSVYEIIKYDMDIKYIKYIGNQRSGKYTYSLEEISEYKTTCPDYVIEYLVFNNIKIKLIKPIIIEYYGFYRPNSQHLMFQKYITKTQIKNQFYMLRDDILFVALYPDDLNNNYAGLKDKIKYILESVDAKYNIA